MPPKRVPRGYFTLKEKCVMASGDGLPQFRESIDGVGKHERMCVRVCSKGPPHKCLRRIVSSAGSYDRSEEKK